MDIRSVLPILPESQTTEVKTSLSSIAKEAFSICGDVCCVKQACVPARAALYKQYLHMARASKASGKPPEKSGTPSEKAAKLEHALRHLKNSLCKMDPMHGNWYRYEYRLLYGEDTMPDESGPGYWGTEASAEGASGSGPSTSAPSGGAGGSGGNGAPFWS